MVSSASKRAGTLTVYVTSAAGSSIDSLLLQARYERAIIGLHPERRCRSATIDCFETFSVSSAFCPDAPRRQTVPDHVFAGFCCTVWPDHLTKRCNRNRRLLYWRHL